MSFMLTLEVVWSDPDLIEIEARLTSDSWAGREQAYATRQELLTFADELDGVANGGVQAVLEAGQPDLSWVKIRVYEYGMTRCLSVAIDVGRNGNSIREWPHGDTQLKTAFPIERGTLKALAAGLRRIVAAERGMVQTPILDAWP